MSKSIGHAFLRRHFFNMSAGVWFLAVYAAFPYAAAATNEKPKDVHPCSASVYVADPDPNGLNIRSGPNQNAAIVQVIPFDDTGTMVDITAGYGNWMRISYAQGFDTDFRFQGEGWVYAPLLAVDAVHNSGRKIPLYRDPDLNSKVLETLPGETEVRLAGCRGEWLQVTAGKQQGWLAPGDYCGSPVTTCS